MSMIGTFNRAVSGAINTHNADYMAIIGDPDFVPEAVISESGDFNCGALCNELEYLRKVSQYYVRSFDLDVAAGINLDDLITAFIDLPRRNRGEPDTVFRNRFRTLVNQSVNRRRTTRWAILDALRYFIANVDSAVQVIEIFEVTPTYFQLRIEGFVSFDEAMFLNNPETGFLDQNFVGGEGVGEVISYVGELVDRIKAAGVDYDLIFIKQSRFEKTAHARIGTVQMYKTSLSVVSSTGSFIKTANATVV